jgi:methylisocitrate lyase
VIPNPWDVGSARALAGLGFPALATTSAGFAWSLGRPDNHVSLEEALAHFRAIANGVEVPVNADFEGGFATAPAAMAANVTAATATGIAGLSIEDSTGDPSKPLFDFTLAIERIRAAREAIDGSGTGVLLTGRSEGFIVGRPDLAETIRRLTAYAEAGADCLYAPGLTDLDQIRRVVEEVGAPVNVLGLRNGPRMGELEAVGVRRVSTGSLLAGAAYGALVAGARELHDRGTSRYADGHIARDVLNDALK